MGGTMGGAMGGTMGGAIVLYNPKTVSTPRIQPTFITKE